MATIGLHMIVKDGMKTLPSLLASVEGVFDQTVIVDTGSTDGTVEWIKEHYPSIEVHSFKWCYNFSKARNYALSLLSTDYACWLDADDLLMDSSSFKKAFNDLVQSPDKTHVVLEYKYATDRHGNTAVTHFRERILKDPKMWEWREPVHEVCCYKEEGKDSAVINKDCYVLHKPIRSESESSDRNWNILNRDLFENPVTSHRTLYYVQKEALHRKQFEYAVYVGLLFFKRLAESKQFSGHYFHECTKNLGESFIELYKATNDELYLNKAEEILRLGVDRQPEFNESRNLLIDVLLMSKKYGEALDTAESLREEVPHTLFCVYPINYGMYKYARLCEISIKYMEDFNSAIHYHLLSKDTEQPSSLVFDNEQTLKSYMELYNIGVMYSSEKYLEKAFELKEHLIRIGEFDGVAITTCVAAVGVARKWYFHLSDEVDSVYMEDGHPHLKKVYISETLPNEAPYGYHLCVGTGSAIDMTSHLFRKDAIEFIDRDLSASFNRFRGCTYADQDRIVSLCTDIDVSGKITNTLIDYGDKSRVTFVVNTKNEIVAIYGPSKLVSEINVTLDRKRILVYAPDLNRISWKVLDADGQPVSVVVNPKRKLVVFYASGVEEWDGNTPFKFGIGASESSLVYLAEEFVKQGIEVVVYNTVTSPRVVAGVRYLPSSYMSEIPTCDLFVSSRTPEVLKNQRKAKKQALWMHDLPSAYTDRIDYKNIDFLIAVSAWEKKVALNNGMPADKIVVLPNGVYDISWIEREGKDAGRSIWVSDPERGIANIFDIHRETGMFTNLYLLYGFYNGSKFRPTKDRFMETLVLKKRLRDAGIRICGRLSNADTRKLLSKSHFLAYPSAFPETQCVSVLEALSEGVQVFLNRNGATVDTAKSYGRRDLVNVVTDNKAYTHNDLSIWAETLPKRIKTPANSQKINPKHSWNAIIKGWLCLLGE